MVQFGIGLVSIIIELIQLTLSEELQFVLKFLIVFCLLGKLDGIPLCYHYGSIILITAFLKFMFRAIGIFDQRSSILMHP